MVLPWPRSFKSKVGRLLMLINDMLAQNGIAVLDRFLALQVQDKTPPTHSTESQPSQCQV
jgi:hypothetical protein